MCFQSVGEERVIVCDNQWEKIFDVVQSMESVRKNCILEKTRTMNFIHWEKRGAVCAN